MKLPKCPHCKSSIDQLQYTVSGLMTYRKGEWLEDGNPSEECFCTECGAEVSRDTLIY